MSLSAQTAGDLGDVASGVLGVLHAIPGKHTLLLRDDGRTKGIVKREAIIRPLVEAQPYIQKCRVWKDEEVDWPSEKFRNGFHDIASTLLFAHGSHAKSLNLLDSVPTGAEAWLTASKDKRAAGRVVINRSPRYQNSSFPWGKIVEFYGNALLFVGLPEEHYMFEQVYGPVEYQPTKHLLEVAELIAGANQFIGNQSVAFNIAEGLKVPRILEMCLTVCDCVYPDDGKVQWVADGAVKLEHEGKNLSLYSNVFDTSHIHPSFVPPGGWQFDSEETGHVMTSHLDTCVRDVAKRGAPGTKEELRDRVIRANMQRVPRFFLRQMPTAQFSVAKRALQNAGVTTHPVIELMSGKIQFNV